VTIYYVDEHHYTHTHPGDDTPHVVDIRRSIVKVRAGQTCRKPTRTPGGRIVACSRMVPPDQQCQECRVSIRIRNVAVTHLGPEQPSGPPQPSGMLPDPCQVCGRPVAAILADTGRHVLCTPAAAARLDRLARALAKRLEGV
jgi:hypothetical protein